MQNMKGCEHVRRKTIKTHIAQPYPKCNMMIVEVYKFGLSFKSIYK